jgi:hypothetical protein
MCQDCGTFHRSGAVPSPRRRISPVTVSGARMSGRAEGRQATAAVAPGLMWPAGHERGPRAEAAGRGRPGMPRFPAIVLRRDRSCGRGPTALFQRRAPRSDS